MNCRHAQNLFDAHLNGELSSGLETELAAHCVRCSDCRQQMALLEVAGHVIRSDKLDDDELLGDDFTNRLLACVVKQAGVVKRNDSTRRPTLRMTFPVSTPSRPWWIGGSIAAAAVVALSFKLLLGPGADANDRRATLPAPMIAGVKFEKAPPDPELDEAAQSLTRQVESSLSSHAENASSVIRIGELTLMQMLNQFDAGDSANAARPDPESANNDAARQNAEADSPGPKTPATRKHARVPGGIEDL
jgi:hypothetical protein